MKKITLIAIALLLSFTGYSQYYQLKWELGMNPGGANTDSEFPVGGGLPGGWTTITTGPSSSWSGDINLPFTFNFNGTDYTTCKVAPGFLTFGTPGSFPGVTPTALPNSNVPDNTIAIWGLSIGSGDFIISKTFGSSPNRQFWVQMNTAGNANVQSGWAYWSIVLEEGSNNIYIVDQRNQCVTSTNTVCTGKPLVSAGIQIDGSTAISIPGSPSLAGIAGNDATPNDNVYYTFYQGTQPDEDILMVGGDMVPDYELAGGGIEIKGSFRNIGKNEITSFDLNYSVNGGATVTQNVTGVSIKSGDYYNFTHETDFTPASSDSYAIKIWTSNPNGNADGNMDNDDVTVNIKVHDKVFVRKPLYEIYTSSTCGPCRPGNENFHNIIDGKEDECVYVKFQQSWPSTGDPYCTAESNARRTYYGINSIPRMELDGGWDQNATAFTEAIHNEYKSKPSFVGITATSIQWGKHVEVNVEIEPAADYSGNNLLHVAIMERATYENIKTNGESEFTHVMKKMMTGGNGVNIGSLKSGDKVNKTYTWNFKGDYTLPPNGQSANWINHNVTNTVEEFDDLFVAVWVQNETTKEVYQSAYAVQQNVGVVDLSKESKFTIFPNPATDQANVTFDLTQNSNVQVSIINVSGQEVASQNAGELNAGENTVSVDLSSLTSGVYYVQLKTDFGIFTNPVTIK